ncbi:hypothetical protein NQ314_010562 [Rhamnusium bicolor]|uniref:UBFD1 PH-like C-terminal domain-containing protein n=1 Tax=Rhamnusium bicolor TaxID=1586634 RepID=A0AAV8XPJ6_9CUCU|nr:hypothetical protein NQ314_010562 [Rhamnusium bicolor]
MQALCKIIIKHLLNTQLTSLNPSKCLPKSHNNILLSGLQLGPTDASRYWIYWVPAQYIDAIKDAVLGKWQYF